MRLTSRKALAAVAIASTASIAFSTVAATGEDRRGDMWEGTPRADQYMGSRYDDMALGRGGPDAMQGHRGMDWLFGDAGWDSLSGGLRSDMIWGGTGSDLTTGGDAADLVMEDDGDDLVNGGAGGDWLLVGLGSDVVRAGPGRDLALVVRDGNPDTLKCGTGRDLVAYLGAPDASDRYRGCEQRYRIGELEELIVSGAVELPPFPPILDSLSVSVEAEAAKSAPRAPVTRPKALRWSVRQLRASAS